MPEIAPLDNRPWIPRPIPTWIIKELNRRRNDFGIEYPKKPTGWDDSGNWNTYKGPMTPWVRFCSNGNGKSKFLNPILGAKDKYEGFVLYGGNGFRDTFGIGDNKNILGYEVGGEPHTLPLNGSGFNYFLDIPNANTKENIPMYLPCPGIISVDADIKKELVREITIKWNCYGFAQLEYMTPYFLTPGISCIVEFGWNHFNLDSLLDLTDKQNLISLWQDGTPLYDINITNSRGMYDVTFGIITNFEFSTQDGIKYDCSTTITSKHRNFSGVQLQNPNYTEEKTTDGEVKKQALTFVDFVIKRLKKVKDAFIQNKNFFEPLDDSEEELKLKQMFNLNPSGFYKGKPENRVFFGRQDVPDSSFLYKNQNANIPRDGDWDYQSNDNIWVTGGFLIELFNKFLTKSTDLQTSDETVFKYYQISETGNIIGAHPNLISTNGKVLLIPNAKAPKYNNGIKYKPNGTGSFDNFDDQTLTLDSNVFLSFYSDYKNVPTSSYADTALYKTFITGKKGQAGIARDNLDEIINVFRYKTQSSGNVNYSFPQYQNTDRYTKTNQINGKYGYFEDLFINVNFITETVKDCKTVGEFYDKLFQSLNEATNGFWDLKIIESLSNLAITDEKYFSPLDFKAAPVYQFDTLSSRNIIKNINFTSTISNIQANQVIASSTNNQGAAESSTSPPPDFYYGDRFFTSSEPPASAAIEDDSIQNSQAIQQLQTFGNGDGSKDDRFVMTFWGENTKNDGNVNIATLALPNPALLTSLLDDGDFDNNTNVYGGQQPNFTLELTLQGISGFRTFQCFSIKSFPRPYSDNDVIFQIKNVNHSVTNNNWETRITAGLRPLRGIKPEYIDGSEL
jgi:hypothetical protein